MKTRRQRAGKVIPDLTKIASEVSRRLEFLPALRRKSIQPVFERPGDYVLLSLRQVARKLRVDPSTLLRTLRSLGFGRYADFRTYLHARTVAFVTSLEATDQS